MTRGSTDRLLLHSARRTRFLPSFLRKNLIVAVVLMVLHKFSEATNGYINNIIDRARGK